METAMERVARARRERAEATARCLATLRQFSEGLYRELTRLLDTLRAEGIDDGAEPTTTSLSNGLAILTFQWEGSRVTLKPMDVMPGPRPNSSAASVLGGGPCGRIVVFLQPRGVCDEAHHPVHEILISPSSGRYFTEGLGLGAIGDFTDASIAGAGAAPGLLHQLTFEIQRWHRPLDRTTFGPVTKGAVAAQAPSTREGQLVTPKGFLCHSSADKPAFADRLARDLRAAGVDVWYDEWEIEPGQSLRRKVDSGIEGATHFLALITPNSVKSEWVQTELDAALIRKIEGTCRLIPVLAGVAVADLPPTLRSIRCVRLDPYEAGLREVIGVCHGVSEKPPLGTPPAWAVEQPLPQTGLSGHAQRLAALLNERSEYALAARGAPDPILSLHELVDALGMTESEVDEAADELETIGWAILLRRDVYGLSITLGHVRPSPLLFVDTDPALKGWNPREDARALAAVIVNSGQDFVPLVEAEKALGWGFRRLNAAAHALKIGGDADAVGGDRSYDGGAYHGFHVTVKTRRLVKGA